MLLSANEILKQMEAGKIKIDPFNPKNLNPNSYDVTIGSVLKIYICENGYLSPEKVNRTAEIEFGSEGIVLAPDGLYHPHDLENNILDGQHPHVRAFRGCYLAATQEYTEVSGDIVPMLHGRSSWARLFLDVHKTAGFGDIGFKGTWTLELQPHIPVLVKPGYKVAQLAYHYVSGDVSKVYNGKYVGQVKPEASRLHKEFNNAS